MTWEELAREFDRELKRLWRGAWPPSGKFPTAKLGEIDSVDAAIREFCSSGKWPEFSPRELLEICHRLSNARSISVFLQGPDDASEWPIAQPSASHKVIFQALLTDASLMFDIVKHPRFWEHLIDK